MVLERENGELSKAEKSWTRLWWSAFWVVSAARCSLAALVPLQGTEGYYWLWSLHLAGGYYDHPPLIAWAISLSTRLFGTSEFTVRLPLLLGMTCTNLVIWKLAQQMRGSETAAKAGLAGLALPYLSFMAVTAFPDGLLLGFISLSLLALWRGRDFLAGLAMGFAFLAKFPALFVALASVAWLRVPRKISLWFSGALLAAFPFLHWSSQNKWMTFAFQFGSRQSQEAHFQLFGPVDFLAIQAAAVSPLLLLSMGVAVIWVAVRRAPEASFLSWHFLIPFALFACSSFQHKIMPHWPLIAYPTGLIALGFLGEQYPKAWKWSVGVGFCFLTLLVTIGLWPSLLFQALQAEKGSSLTEPYGVVQLGRSLAEKRENITIFADNHSLASTLQFYSQKKIYWYSRNLHGRQFLLWDDYASLRGRDVIFIDTKALVERPDVLQLLQENFETVEHTEEFLATWNGKAARTFYLTTCRNFRGHPPLPVHRPAPSIPHRLTLGME